ncbi:MAG: Adaptive-response sensory-kinase SasA [Bacteroidia bacterium]|nr:Adaptive-response sensory-kinase SasA [Bacteroidia bacterium]
MDIVRFSTWIVIFNSFTSFILIASLWSIYFKTDTKIIDANKTGNEYKDYGLLFLAIALFVWGVRGLFIQYFYNYEYIEIIKNIFSSLNSLCFLLASIYLKHAPNWVITNINRTKFLFVVAFLITISLTISIASFFPNSKYTDVPDLVLSIFTVAILSYSLFMNFWKRGLSILSFFSVIILFLLLGAQPAIGFVLKNASNDLYVLVGLYSRLSFIIIIYLLAFSWAQKNFINASAQVADLSGEVSSLKEEAKLVKEAASKDERDSAWQDVAMKAAHKIGNPIDAIETNKVTILKRLNAQDIKGARELLGDMGESIIEAKQVLSEFKSLTKLNQKRVEHCDIMKIIRQACRHISPEDIKINIDILNKKLVLVSRQNTKDTVVLGRFKEDETVHLFIDREKIKQVFDELISNSQHFFEEVTHDKIINITVENLKENLENFLLKDRDYIKIVYSDNGIGIPLDRKHQIFSAFYTTYQHGSGLGLAIVERIIKLHEGFIIENGEKDKGVRFEIYLPINTEKK